MQIFAGVPLGGGVKRHSTLCKKYAKMTAMVILYIGFSLKRSRKPGKLREFHFAKFVSTLYYYVTELCGMHMHDIIIVQNE